MHIKTIIATLLFDLILCITVLAYSYAAYRAVCFVSSSQTIELIFGAKNRILLLNKYRYQSFVIKSLAPWCVAEMHCYIFNIG